MSEQDTPPEGYQVPRPAWAQDTPPEGYRIPQPLEHAPPPSAPPPRSEHGGLFGLIARRPRDAFWTILGVALIVGGGIGFAAGQDETESQRSRANAAEEQVASVERERDDVSGRAESAEARVAELEQQVATLSAKGEVPAYVGDDISDVADDQAIEAYNWKLHTRKQVSDKPPGTVLSQTPREGATLKAGRSITLVVAKKPPPKPKQWVTIKTLSGGSSTQTDEFTIPDGVRARLHYSMPSDANNIIELYDTEEPDFPQDLLLNEIGPQSGTTRIYAGGTYFLDVTGTFTIQVQVYKRPE